MSESEEFIAALIRHIDQTKYVRGDGWLEADLRRLCELVRQDERAKSEKEKASND